MDFIYRFEKLGRELLDLVFPISCLECGAEGIYLCKKCASKLPKLEFQQCLVCQKPSPFGKTHPDCVTRNSVDGALSALSYKGRNVKKIIEVFKYNFVSNLAKPLSEVIRETVKNQGLENYFQDFIVVPIPLHRRRFSWRGFNQAKLLAEDLAVHLGITLNETMVVRFKYTRPQVGLMAEDRKRNLENAFRLDQNAIDKKILLVDDVITSGSTANELAKLFKKAHAKEVWIITAAHG